MTALIEPVVGVTVSARAAATAWVNTFLAAGQEEDRPALYRTLALEWFDERGVHFVGCNGSALFREWVSSTEGEPWPELDEAPERSIVVMDPEGFGLAFMRTLLRVTSDEAHEHERLTITSAPVDDEASPVLGAAFQTERLTLRACGQRIDLRLYGGAYPEWRKLNLGIDPAERVPFMLVATKMFALIGKLKGVTRVDQKFFGTDKKIEFVADGEGREVRGVIMPMGRRGDAR